MATTPAKPAATKMAAPQVMSSVAERDTAPQWFRIIIAGATVIAGNARTYAFNKAKNTDPDLTNLEVAGAMPSTSEFKVSAIELRPNSNCAATALNTFLSNHRLKLEVGSKGFEKVNAPCVMFPSLSDVAGLHNSQTSQIGLFRFNPGEEVYLQASQVFNLYFEADRDGCTVGGAGENLDLIVVLHGQKASKVSL